METVIPTLISLFTGYESSQKSFSDHVSRNFASVELFVKQRTKIVEELTKVADTTSVLKKLAPTPVEEALKKRINDRVRKQWSRLLTKATAVIDASVFDSLPVPPSFPDMVKTFYDSFFQREFIDGEIGFLLNNSGSIAEFIEFVVGTLGNDDLQDIGATRDKFRDVLQSQESPLLTYLYRRQPNWNMLVGTDVKGLEPFIVLKQLYDRSSSSEKSEVSSCNLQDEKNRQDFISFYSNKSDEEDFSSHQEQIDDMVACVRRDEDFLSSAQEGSGKRSGDLFIYSRDKWGVAGLKAIQYFQQYFERAIYRKGGAASVIIGAVQPRTVGTIFEKAENCWIQLICATGCEFVTSCFPIKSVVKLLHFENACVCWERRYSLLPWLCIENIEASCENLLTVISTHLSECIYKFIQSNKNFPRDIESYRELLATVESTSIIKALNANTSMSQRLASVPPPPVHHDSASAFIATTPATSPPGTVVGESSMVLRNNGKRKASSDDDESDEDENEGEEYNGGDDAATFSTPTSSQNSRQSREDTDFNEDNGTGKKQAKKRKAFLYMAWDRVRWMDAKLGGSRGSEGKHQSRLRTFLHEFGYYSVDVPYEMMFAYERMLHRHPTCQELVRKESDSSPQNAEGGSPCAIPAWAKLCSTAASTKSPELYNLIKDGEERRESSLERLKRAIDEVASLPADGKMQGLQDGIETTMRKSRRNPYSAQGVFKKATEIYATEGYSKHAGESGSIGIGGGPLPIDLKGVKKFLLQLNDMIDHGRLGEAKKVKLFLMGSGYGEEAVVSSMYFKSFLIDFRAVGIDILPQVVTEATNLASLYAVDRICEFRVQDMLKMTQEEFNNENANIVWTSACVNPVFGMKFMTLCFLSSTTQFVFCSLDTITGVKSLNTLGAKRLGHGVTKFATARVAVDSCDSQDDEEDEKQQKPEGTLRNIYMVDVVAIRTHNLNVNDLLIDELTKQKSDEETRKLQRAGTAWSQKAKDWILQVKNYGNTVQDLKLNHPVIDGTAVTVSTSEATSWCSDSPQFKEFFDHIDKLFRDVLLSQSWLNIPNNRRAVAVTPAARPNQRDGSAAGGGGNEDDSPSRTDLEKNLFGDDKCQCGGPSGTGECGHVLLPGPNGAVKRDHICKKCDICVFSPSFCFDSIDEINEYHGICHRCARIEGEAVGAGK